MKVSTALLERRTIRKFKQLPVDNEMLLELVNYARLAPFAGNIQARHAGGQHALSAGEDRSLFFQGHLREDFLGTI